MELNGSSLEQLGSSAYGHYKAGEKAKERADQQYTSAGIYLSEAKARLDLRKNPDAAMNFAEFLLKHCPIGKSRAYEIIAISDGRKTVEEVKKRNNPAKRETAEAKLDSGAPETTDGLAYAIIKEGGKRVQGHKVHSAHSAAQRDTEDSSVPTNSETQNFVDEAQDAHDALLEELIMFLRRSNTATLNRFNQLKETLS